MTLLFVEGSDDGLFADKWSSVSATWSDTVTARNGNGFQKTSGSGQLNYNLAAADEHATLILGAAVKYTSLPTVANPDRGRQLRWLADGQATVHVDFGVLSTGAVAFYRGAFGSGTLLAESAIGVVNAGSFHYLEVFVTLSDTVGVVKCNIDGTEVINTTSLDTKNGGTDTVFDGIQIYAHTNDLTDTIWDDLYILNGAGSSNNDFLGDCVVETLSPDGNGNYSDFTGSDGNSTDNYLLVDDAPNPDGDTTYVAAGTAGDTDSYTFDDMTADTTATVFGVQIGGHVRHEGAGGTMRWMHRRSTTDTNGATQTPASGYDWMGEIMEQDGAAGPGAWTVTNVNASEFGPDIVS